MESGETCGSVIGRMKKVDKTRRTWSAREEEVLITALKDVITKDTDACNTSVAEDDSISETHTPSSKPNAATTSKKIKRKQLNEVDDAIVAAINNLTDITKVTMNDLVKQLAAPDILSDAQDVVLEALRGMNELSEDEQVIAAQLLFNNHNNLALFKRLNDRGKLSLVRRLLRSE
ncbi:DEAD-box ATP-dependent RNA helicase 17 [Dorcoceras hygrometricum]|uniref:DEAD-box ATP-dependent RNA helicase 17 n=1 Tax=Dorcoceras hygrometricum TaxID=472368 RepID=A0A2Z7CK40_9LAMI|nr:DEAD-box ATP-dependent RNA helicase 17 [Dorcoceras hygrometricum]